MGASLTVYTQYVYGYTTRTVNIRVVHTRDAHRTDVTSERLVEKIKDGEKNQTSK